MGRDQDHMSWLIGKPGGGNMGLLYINNNLLYPRIYAMIKVIRPVHGWEENKYIATSPYTPLFAIICSGGKICNVFEIGKNESKV